MLLLFLATFPLIQFLPTAKADSVPPGWLSGYTYRKKHAVTGAAGAGVGYQMMFIVRRASGTDAGNTVYVSGKCKEDFSDVRFADADGNVFPYAITYKTSDEAWFWIKPSLDLSQNQYIYAYYGNPEAHDESNPDSTFVYAEPWDNATLNPNRWTIEAGQTSYFTVDTTNRRLSIYYSGMGGTQMRLRSTRTNITFPSAYRVESWLARQGDTEITSIGFRFRSNGGSAGSGGNARLDWSIQSGQYSVGDGGVVFATHFYTAAATPYYRRWYGVGHVDESAISAPADTDFYYLFTRNSAGNINILTSAGNNFTKANYEAPNRIYFAIAITGSYTYVGNMYVYAFKIRKYVSPEPSHGEWYQEEAITATQARLNVNVEPSWLSYVAFTLDYPTRILFAPWSDIVGTGSHTLTVLDEKIRVNGSYVFGFKCWKKAGEIVSFDKSYTPTLSAGTTDITIVYTAHNVSIVSNPEMYVRVKIDDFQVQTPTTVYRGSGYYNFEALDTQLYYNATHMLKFYGWYVDNVYIGSDPNVNIYISYKTTIRLAYKAVEVPAPPPMTFKASVVDLGQIQAGTSRDFAVTVTFDATALTIQSVEFQAKSDWLQVADTMPMYAAKGLEAVGTATIMCRLTVPQSVQGYYSIPYKVTAKTSQDITITTSSYITFTATPQPVAVEAVSAQPAAIAPAGFAETVQRILGNPLILILLIALTIWLAAYTIKKRS